MPVYLGNKKVGVTIPVKSTKLPTLSNEGLASDLMLGKQLIDEDGRVITGTYVPLDTSDATATAQYIEAGITAYVDGEKVTGVIPHKYGGIQAEAMPTEGNINGAPAVQLAYEPSEKNIISPERGGVFLKTPMANFGNTTAEDVIAGTTFTSVDGLNATGTFTLANELTSQQDLIAQIFSALEGKMTGGNVIATHDGQGNVTLVNVAAYNDGSGNIVLE